MYIYVYISIYMYIYIYIHIYTNSGIYTVAYLGFLNGKVTKYKVISSRGSAPGGREEQSGGKTPCRVQGQTSEIKKNMSFK